MYRFLSISAAILLLTAIAGPNRSLAEDKEPDIGSAIKSLLAGKGNLKTMRLDVRWGGRGSATVYGMGVGIWNQQTQFRLSKDQLLGLLKILDDGKFTSLKSGYGGRPRGPVGGPAIGAPEVLVGNVTLIIGKLTKGSMQRGGGEQSKELAALAGKLLDVCEKAAKDGVTATDLDDGLKKIAAGKLHPLTLSLLVQRIENEGRGPNGWILRINGRDAQVQVRSRAGIGSPLQLNLTDKDLDALCNLLIKNDAADLPINLYAPDYTDFNVSILRARKNLQARKFARLTPTTYGEKQKNFNRIYAALDALHQRIVKEGKRQGVGVLQRVSFILKDEAKPKTLVLKSPADVRKHVSKELRAAARYIDLNKIDFKKYFVVVIAAGRTNAFGVRISINKVDVAPDRKSATVHWTYRPYLGGAAPPNRPGNPGILALIERFDGKIKFQKTVYQLPKGTPLPPKIGPPLRRPVLKQPTPRRRP